MDYQNIERMANEVRKKWGIEIPNFDLTKLLSEEFYIGLQDMEDDVTGTILVKNGGVIEEVNKKGFIGVNKRIQEKDDFSQRLRFIVAHEYGHYILHNEQHKPLFASRSYSLSGEIDEMDADCFARCLLMPRDSVVSMFTELTSQNVAESEKIKQLASMFNVTPKKARDRVRELRQQGAFSHEP